MERYYCFAGVELALEIPQDRMFSDERRLAPFAVESAEAPHRFCFGVVDELPAPEGAQIAKTASFLEFSTGDGTVRYVGAVNNSWQDAYMRIHHEGLRHDVQLKSSQYPGRIGVHTVLNALALEHLVARAGGFILHASYIEWNGRAILFTAPSGTGKSTQADLWHNLRGAQIINGDRAAVRIVEGDVIAEGVPFSGSSKICKNCSLPLAAVVYLKQAPSTQIRRLRGFEAFRRIWEGCSVNTWDTVDVGMVSDTVKSVTETVPVCELACTPDESAIIALEKMLSEEVQP